jgi:hypothetical protein
MDEVDDIFRVSDSSGPDDQPKRVKVQSKKSGRVRPGSPPLIMVAYEDSEEALDDLRDRLADNYGRFQQDLEDLKHEHSEKLAMLKHNNLAKEQAQTNSYNTKYQNRVWSVTLKHIGCGMFTEDLEKVLQHQLSEEQFKFDKEIIRLQQQFEDELVQLRQDRPAHVRGRLRRRRRLVRTIDPKQMASIICQRIADADDTFTGDSSTDFIDGLIMILRKQSRHLPRRRPVSPPHRLPPPRQPPPPPPPRKEEADGTAKLQKHIQARKKLEKTVVRADRFVQDLHEQRWFQEIFPHIE